jgi:hypothetical protein
LLIGQAVSEIGIGYDLGKFVVGKLTPRRRYQNTQSVSSEGIYLNLLFLLSKLLKQTDERKWLIYR